MAPLDKGIDFILFPFQHAFHASVMAVARPAVHPQFPGLLLCGVAVKNPLDESLYAYPGLYLIHWHTPG